jgi:hypothetical protein
MWLSLPSNRIILGITLPLLLARLTLDELARRYAG